MTHANGEDSAHPAEPFRLIVINSLGSIDCWYKDWKPWACTVSLLDSSLFEHAKTIPFFAHDHLINLEVSSTDLNLPHTQHMTKIDQNMCSPYQGYVQKLLMCEALHTMIFVYFYLCKLLIS